MEENNLHIQESQQENTHENSLRGGGGAGGAGPVTPFDDNRPESMEQKLMQQSINNRPENLVVNL